MFSIFRKKNFFVFFSQFLIESYIIRNDVIKHDNLKLMFIYFAYTHYPVSLQNDCAGMEKMRFARFFALCKKILMAHILGKWTLNKWAVMEQKTEKCLW